MSTIVIPVLFVLLGLFFGSFVGATVWRLRVRQLRSDEAEGEKINRKDKSEVSKIKKQSIFNDRSVCLHCGHRLKWYDLIPLASWLYLNGRCRYCKKPIGSFEPLVELVMAAFFLVSYLCWPTPLDSALDITRLVIWLVAGVGLAILFVYDARWFLLPNAIVFPLIGLGVVNAVVVLAENNFAVSEFMSILYGCAVLGGLYYLIYVVSKHQWIGFGDVKLGFALALLLADWQLAVLALFLANVIGTIIFLPLMAAKKIKRNTHIPFGPLLIGGWFVAGIFGARILDWYLSITLGV